MASSTLCLTIDRGPKAGETLACNPGTVIRIGRVVRGNTFVIKDPSISQKHLTVGFLPEISRWVVTDLGSSNGTYVNDSLISPDEEPTSLSDGDVIKIGEKTSISVRISDPVDQPLLIPRCDRPPRPPKQVKLEDKEWEENVDEPSKNGQRARGRGRKGGGSTRVKRNVENLESVVMEPRVTRSLARGGSIRVFVKKLKGEDVTIISNSEFVDVMEKEKQLEEKNARVKEEVIVVDAENHSGTEEVEDNMDNISKENNAGVVEEVSRVEKDKGNMNNISKENAGDEEEVLTLDGKIDSRVEDMEDNMNNMTLGEWFDRMEEYLPKSINKVADEIIDKLRKNAQLFDEYISQTSNILVE
ncbi:FHA domain-containing protein At4g14490 [Dendrobium catenatum]|nr:FHA domain-containing protein At4g14490 [Dendrobium catenatum]